MRVQTILKQRLWLSLLMVTVGTVAAVAQAQTAGSSAASGESSQSCPDYRGDPYFERVFGLLDVLQFRATPEYVAELKDLLQKQRLSPESLQDIVYRLGQANLRARYYTEKSPESWEAKHGQPADTAFDDLGTLALGNPCAQFSVFHGAITTLNDYVRAGVTAPQSDSWIKAILGMGTVFGADEVLSDLTFYISRSKRSDSENLALYDQIENHPAVGPFALGALAEVTARVDSDPATRLVRLYQNPKANQDTWPKLGCGVGIAYAKMDPAKVEAILASILNQGDYKVGPQIAEAISCAIGMSQEPLPNEADLLQLAVDRFVDWAKHQNSVDLNNSTTPGKFMNTMAQNSRRVDGLLAAAQKMASVLTMEWSMSGFMSSLPQMAKSGQLTQAELETLFKQIIPTLNGFNIGLVQRVMKDAGFEPTPEIKTMIQERVAKLRGHEMENRPNTP